MKTPDSRAFEKILYQISENILIYSTLRIIEEMR